MDFFCRCYDVILFTRSRRSDREFRWRTLYYTRIMPRPIQTTALEIGVLGFKTISHPPYSPDLAPMDVAIFPTVKKQLKGMRFRSLQELRSATSRIVAQFGQRWNEDVFGQWIHRHRRCVECEGQYFEKK